MNKISKLISVALLALIPMSLVAEPNGYLNYKSGTPAFYSASGFPMKIGTQGNDDLEIMIENAVVQRYDAETLTLLSSLKAYSGSTTALESDAITAFVAQPLMGAVGSSAVQSHLGLVQNVASAAGADIVALKTRAAAGQTDADVIVASGDDVLKIRAWGASGTDYAEAAQILMEVGGTPGASADMPGQISFLISPDGSATPAAVMTWGPTGAVTVNKAADLSFALSGGTIAIQEATAGSACSGTATLTAATPLVITTSCATTGSRVFLTRTSLDADTTGDMSVTTAPNNTSFSVTSETSDTGTINWFIVHEAP